MNSLSDLQPWLYPYARELLRRAAPLGAVLTSTRRTREEQAQLYARYIRGERGYPVAPPGRSLHEAGRAFDVAAPPWVLTAMGELWEYWGGRWGGRFGDPIHFEA